MDRTLVLLRHAKAARPSDTADADRELTDRGHADSAAAGRWLAEQRLHPQRVLCSPARRTRETWLDVAGALGDTGGTEVRYEENAYLAYTGDLLDLVQATPPEVGVLLLVGHNPGVSTLSRMLDPAARPGGELHTAGLAVHRLAGDWSALESAPRISLYSARG